MHVFMHNCYACEFYWFKSDGKLRECHYYETRDDPASYSIKPTLDYTVHRLTGLVPSPITSQV